MTNERMVEIMQAIQEADSEKLPFEIPEYTKDECFDMLRKCYVLLENAGAGPYTLMRFKTESNNLARRHSSSEEYLEHCAFYLEVHVYKRKVYRKY